jgi:TolA-binding protein
MGRAVLLSFLGATLIGCASALARGESEFKNGRYPEAKQTFASLEAEALRWDDANRAEYALYRGLTLGALGDSAHAAAWLQKAKTIEDAHPGSLTPDNARRLKVAIEAEAP